MLKLSVATVLTLAAGLAGAQPVEHGAMLRASGDGEAQLALHNDGVSGVLHVQASFFAELPVKDSTEAHDHSRWFTGELRIDGKPCAQARARLHPRDGVAKAHASTSCSIGVNGDRPLQVQAVVLKSDGLERDEIEVQLEADKQR